VLFNSYQFLFLYLPLTLIVFFLVARAHPRLGSLVLVAASLLFYGYWDARYVPLLAGSAVFNYGMSRLIVRSRRQGRPGGAKGLLATAIAADLLLLGYFKYYGFFASTANALGGWQLPVYAIVLPLGISFFTFTQIAFLVDIHRSEASEHDPMHYLLFVTWFPHLIAGPIIHHRETMPQFDTASRTRFDWLAMATGSAMLTMGLFKKVVLADSIGHYVAANNAVSAFTKSALGVHVGFFDGWAAALAYTLQLYFDFSGYSDMAIGLSLMFGVRFPANFNSPYKAVNIIDFWRRWHMTLSRFLRDYLYVPLGGNRRGSFRRYLNLMITMLIGGLWHGAGWTFVIWGGLHGLYLVVNHGWRSLRRAMGADLERQTRLGRFAARAVTFLAVVVAWVFFRSVTVAAALDVLKGMAGLNGFTLLEADRAALGSIGTWLAMSGVRFEQSVQMSIVPVGLWILALLPIAWWMPNSQEILGRFEVILSRVDDRPVPPRLSWRPTIGWAIVAAVAFTIALLNLTKPSEFLYYQF
jgi:D-alanyl-lipoteichoic acid acyltransferase DltB (MBOAT superfamily)